MDSDAFKDIVVKHHRQMYRIAYAIVGNESDAEDMVQETVIKMWNRRHLMNGIENYSSYCSTMVRNQSIDFVRSRQAVSVDIEPETVEIVDNRSADYELNRQEDLIRIKDMLCDLPENMRRVMQLRVFSDCSMEDISTITGLSNGNIRTLLSRARKRLKEFFENQNR